MMSIKRLLIANRGEIACRIIKTCRKLNIPVVTVYTEHDEKAAHVELADESFLLTNGYLDIKGIVEICKNNGVDAVHPGYGFLSENTAFCKDLEDAGVLFLGPTPKSIEEFGMKHLARELAKQANVPVVPGSSLLLSEDDSVTKASEIGFPVVLKASGGGGGIGMYVCWNAEELKKNFSLARSKGESFFGNSAVYLEKYIAKSRHIEVQVFGDGHGKVIHLGERECSIQRRHQKVIEESPSPFFISRPDNLKKKEEMLSSAVRLASMVNYRSAGTIEFIVDDETAEYYFLEMNTRLQVEHPVTENVYGVDVVDMMIQLGVSQLNNTVMNLDLYKDRTPNGHSIEARVYCENPYNNYLPTPGLLTQVTWLERTWARYDTWVKTGTVVTRFYDPLLCKVVVHGNDRNQAIDRLTEVLNGSIINGPVTNLEFLHQISTSNSFKMGDTTTKFLDSFNVHSRTIEIISPGISTSVQDVKGRYAYSFGIPPSGAMDPLSLEVANKIVGNVENSSTAAGLEITIKGPRIHFHFDTVIAITGCEINAKIDGHSIDMWSRIPVRKGSILDLHGTTGKDCGSRAYLAILGGIDVPTYLGSKSTFPACALGGYQGRCLSAGDFLKINQVDAPQIFLKSFCLSKQWRPIFSKNWKIGVMPGPQANPDYFDSSYMEEFYKAEWKVHHNSNRMGVRLVGPKPKWSREHGGEGGSHPSNLLDNGYPVGAINFTGDSPVILTVDGPSMGGFACPATIVTGEMWKVGQLASGDTVTFYPISIEYAHDIKKRNRTWLDNIEKLANGSITDDKSDYTVDCVGIDQSRVYNDKPCDAIIGSLPESENHPLCIYRQGGDEFLLVEYGPHKFDINIRARVLVLQQYLEKKNVQGILSMAGAVRTLLIQYNSTVLPQKKLVELLKEAESNIPPSNQLKISSRKIYLPITVNDPWCQAAVDQYAKLVRPDAPYVPSNVDYIARINGLESEAEACKILANATWLVTSIGFYLGCPFMCPVDPRHRLIVPKYNPSRNYTPEGAVGIGGLFGAIYPLESPGGYQLFGRTIPIWDTFGNVSPFTPEKPWLLQEFDQIIFQQVTGDELTAIRKKCLAGKYSIRVESDTFDLVEYNKFVESIKVCKLSNRKYINRY
eukprot:TRINITY_DN817_c0_g1_i2.p1 TRINITY_DN817_c0_g1~~TRINITY_DN817_c0_g1_i2.p1  ORF type:complete len:1126 (-),score=145.54 TRINITY_DN817_c0_g1_i2:515-3892(-)